MTIIKIAGRLAGAHVALVEEYVGQVLAAGKGLVLDLKDITDVDAAGRGLLVRLIAKGVRLRARGVYTRHLVKELESRAGVIGRQ